MDKNNQNEDVADFSAYLKKDDPQDVSAEQVSPIQEYKKAVVFTKRVKYLVVILMLLIIAQVVVLFLTKKSSTVQVPAGYRLVTPPGQPAYIELVK